MEKVYLVIATTVMHSGVSNIENNPVAFTDIRKAESYKRKMERKMARHNGEYGWTTIRVLEANCYKTLKEVEI